jgi:ubiquinone/menaquinone biosynthesis C-methylase UbiE
LPFQDQQYDFVVCLGVIQHTPNPEQTITSLFKQVKPGGWLIIDHYTFKLSHYTKTTEIFRFFLKRLSADRGLKVTESIINLFFPMHKAVRKIYPLQAILSRISPVHSYYFAYPQLSHEDQCKWSLLYTHDSLTDWYKHLRSKTQIKNHLTTISGREIYCEYSSHGIDARCKK